MARKSKPLPTQEELKSLFDYSEDSGVLIWKQREFKSLYANHWNTRHAGKPAGVKNSAGYLTVKINKEMFLVHRIIWKLIHNEEPLIVDHIDCNPLNNSISNLRAASESLSTYNRVLPVGRLPRGVQPNGYRFMARLKGKYLGTYATPEKAYEVYAKAAQREYNFTPPTTAFLTL